MNFSNHSGKFVRSEGKQNLRHLVIFGFNMFFYKSWPPHKQRILLLGHQENDLTYLYNIFEILPQVL